VKRSTSPPPVRRRRRLALAIVSIALLSAVGGGAIGAQLRSPADAARERRAPRASRITVPVEQRRLESKLTLAGEIAHASPITVKLAGPVGVDAGAGAIVTRVPALDQPVVEGEALLDVSGRPVFVIQGTIPTYRTLSPGATGDDVLQLEQALERMGFGPGTVDPVYDGGTEAALDAWYQARGYTSRGPSQDEIERLETLQAAVSTAASNLREAEIAFIGAGTGTTAAELLGLRQAVTAAQRAVQESADAAVRTERSALQALATATTLRDVAVQARDLAARQLQVAQVPGANDPATGEPFTAEELATRRAALAEAERTLATEQQALNEAGTGVETARAEGARAVTAAQEALVLAQANLEEALRPPDVAAQQRAVDAAAVELLRAQENLTAADARTGTTLPAGELVVIPTLPAAVTAVAATRGGASDGDLVTVSPADTTVGARLDPVDAPFVQPGARALIELRDSNGSFPAAIEAVQGPAAGATAAEQQQMRVVVRADDVAAIRPHVGAAVRVVVDVASTDAEVLVVPVAAVTLGADGGSRVEVEREPVTDVVDGRTEIVPVDVGLRAQGLVEIRPPAGALAAGDRVVVGTEIRREVPA